MSKIRRKIMGLKIHYATTDKNVLRGYVVGRAWPKKKKRKSHGPNPYYRQGEGGHGADGANTQDLEGSYSESGLAAEE